MTPEHRTKEARMDPRYTYLSDPYLLPDDADTRRMAISTLAYRANAQRRETQLNDILGPDAAELLADMMATVTNETSTQLMLTERLLKLGWDWESILAAVWYNEDYLRDAARKAG